MFRSFVIIPLRSTAQCLVVQDLNIHCLCELTHLHEYLRPRACILENDNGAKGALCFGGTTITLWYLWPGVHVLTNLHPEDTNTLRYT